jgi:tRNA threonylcarbamoyl adenosine modification protein YeaZ
VKAGDRGNGPWLLAIDTATSVVVVAAGSPDGELLAARTFAAGHRHGSHLLPTIQALIADEALAMQDLVGIVVGLGPGAFTGLRVGLATAKTLAHERNLPIVGISTAEALLRGSAGPLLLPAGPHDRVVVEPGQGPRLEAGGGSGEPAGAIAVDLDGRASEAARQRGGEALAALPAALLQLGARRLASGDVDDAEPLVPAYVSLPRGITTDLGDGGMAWSRDPR